MGLKRWRTVYVIESLRGKANVDESHLMEDAIRFEPIRQA